MEQYAPDGTVELALRHRRAHPRRGRFDRFYVELDDDSERPGGTGGYYILYWNGNEGYDDRVPSSEEIPTMIKGLDIEWLSAEESSLIPGRHRHGRDSAGR